MLRQAGDAGIETVDDGIGAARREIAQGQRLLHVGLGRDELAKPEQGMPERAVGFQETCRILVSALGQAEQLLAQFPSRPQLRAHMLRQCVLPPQHRE